ncbi:MAG TPA: hypothetical protein VGO50_13025 [Pyrinomonadaceae bacterium]|jgi:hypothetical protein|nr:hypothetical protein [Pyrinomonadaceae bacterium]
MRSQLLSPLSTLFILFTLALASVVPAFGAMMKTSRKMVLGETPVQVNVYENAGSGLTFIAPHHNEQTGLNLAKEYIEKYGGRLIEIESYDAKGSPARYITFTANGKTYTIDPNRIFTANGRSCNTSLSEVDAAVASFAAGVLDLLRIEPNIGGKFLVAVHNNTDVDSKAETSRSGDLTAYAFVKASFSKDLAHGIFQDQADGVYLSNTEDDQDNFVFLSGPRYVGYFAEKGFNVVVQKSAAKLNSQKCSVDDGSLSVYSAQQNISYICLEADAVSGGYRQRQMLEAVYQLAKQENAVDAQTVAKK